MISYNIITGDTLTKVFQRIPGGKINLKILRMEDYVLDKSVA